MCVCFCHISCPLLFRLNFIIVRYCLNFCYWYLGIARFNTKTTTTCTQTITHTLTLMTVGRYYPAHTHTNLCQMVVPLIPQYCVKIKLISLTTNYHMYFIMIKWYADTAIFYFSIYHLLLIKCLFWVSQPWYNLLTIKKKLIVTLHVWCETNYFKATEFIIL